MPRRRYGNVDDATLVRTCRDVYAWTQREMGEKLGVTQGAVSQIESARRPLTFALRRMVLRLLTMKEMERCVDRSATNCSGQLLGDPIEYAEHLLDCPKCMAKAWVQRLTPDGFSH
jgi:transcriptional regulator with XRE-family HTH domain